MPSLLPPSPVICFPSTQDLLSEFYGAPTIKLTNQKKEEKKISCKEQVVDKVTRVLGANEVTEMDKQEVKGTGC